MADRMVSPQHRIEFYGRDTVLSKPAKKCGNGIAIGLIDMECLFSTKVTQVCLQVGVDLSRMKCGVVGLQHVDDVCRQGGPMSLECPGDGLVFVAVFFGCVGDDKAIKLALGSPFC